MKTNELNSLIKDRRKSIDNRNLKALKDADIHLDIESDFTTKRNLNSYRGSKDKERKSLEIQKCPDKLFRNSQKSTDNNKINKNTAPSNHSSLIKVQDSMSIAVEEELSNKLRKKLSHHSQSVVQCTLQKNNSDKKNNRLSTKSIVQSTHTNNSHLDKKINRLSSQVITKNKSNVNVKDFKDEITIAGTHDIEGLNSSKTKRYSTKCEIKRHFGQHCNVKRLTSLNIKTKILGENRKKDEKEDDIEKEKHNNMSLFTRLLDDFKHKITTELQINNQFNKMTDKKMDKRIDKSIDQDFNQDFNQDFKVDFNHDFVQKNKICQICEQNIERKFVFPCGEFFCKDCAQNIILAALSNISQFDKIACPGCGTKLEDEKDIKNLLDEDQYEKYCKFKMRIEGLSDKSSIPCPFPDCDGFWRPEEEEELDNKLLNDDKAVKGPKIAKCQNGHLFCTNCLQYSAINNKEFKHDCNNKTEEEIATEKFFNKSNNMRKCPNCLNWVERIPGGCNNMTCTNNWCKYEFCWICNGPYDISHYKNPTSMCFGMSQANCDGLLAKYKSIRFIKCIITLIFFLFITFPIILALSTFIFVGIYFVCFVLDGSSMNYMRLHNKIMHKIFYYISYAFYFAYALALMPAGYYAIVASIICLPIKFIYDSFKEKENAN